MSLHLKQQNTRSPLQNKIAQELQEKAKVKSLEQDVPDGVDDSKFIEGTSGTTKNAWLWILFAVTVVAVAIFIVVV